ncbi:MAG: hypothetical protein GX466_08800 [Candidatus Cloacimonetes bacterium]|nr:hypothetical protein [Candidatus Cloacimonadota bacterium]
MPRRSIIQQYLEENEKKVSKYGQAIDAYNAKNKANIDAYNAKAADFNAFMERVKAGQEYAVADIGLGNMFGGYDPNENAKAEDMIVNGQIQKPFSEEDRKLELDYHRYVMQQQQQLNTEYLQSGGTDLSLAPQYVVPPQEIINVGGVEIPKPADPNISLAEVNSSNDPDAPPRPTPSYVAADSEEGKQLLADWKKPVGQFAMITGQNNEAGDLKYVNTDDRGFAKDAGFLLSGLPTPRPPIAGFANGTQSYWLRNNDGTATRYESKGGGAWAAVSQPMRIAEWNEKPPAAEAMPEQPKFNTLSLREEDELKSPTLDQPGANLAAAHNMPAKTGLVNQLSSGTSVFAERDQQKNISESGILARVLSGQIK